MYVYPSRRVYKFNARRMKVLLRSKDERVLLNWHFYLIRSCFITRARLNIDAVCFSTYDDGY